MFGSNFIDITFEPGEGSMDTFYAPTGPAYEAYFDSVQYGLIPSGWAPPNKYGFQLSGGVWPPSSVTIRCRDADKQTRNLGGSYIRPGPTVICTIAP